MTDIIRGDKDKVLFIRGDKDKLLTILYFILITPDIIEDIIINIRQPRARARAAPPPPPPPGRDVQFTCGAQATSLTRANGHAPRTHGARARPRRRHLAGNAFHIRHALATADKAVEAEEPPRTCGSEAAHQGASAHLTCRND